MFACAVFAGRAQAEMYTPSDAVASSYLSAGSDVRGPEKTYNSSGLSGGGADWYTDPPQHNNSHTTVWLSGNGDTGAWIKWDLGAEYTVRSMRVWNYNEGGEHTGRGIKTADIWISSQTSPGDPGTSGWTKIHDDFSLDEAPGASTYTGDLYTINPTAQSARWIALDTVTNHGNNTYTGLSEIRFFSIPEPSGLLLLLSGLAGLLLPRRRP
jgi:hypothetical protein